MGMIGREIVIKGLECCDGYCDEETGCPYYGIASAFDCEELLRKDAIALLKAQEPVKPLKMAVDHVRKEPVVFSYECPVCMCGLQRHWVACPICGIGVKFE